MKTKLFIIVFLLIGAYLSLLAKQVFTSINTLCSLNSYVRTHNKIDAKWFWEWRDKNYGFYTFDNNVVSPGMTHRFNSNNSEAFLLEAYTAPNIRSVDYVAIPNITPSSLSTIKALSAQENKNIPIKTESNYSLSKLVDSNVIQLETSFTTEELMHTNGLFDFLPEEREQLKEKVWKSVNLIKFSPWARHMCHQPLF